MFELKIILKAIHQKQATIQLKLGNQLIRTLTLEVGDMHAVNLSNPRIRNYIEANLGK